MSTHLLCFSLVRPLILMIDPREVGDDDGDREGDHEHAGQGADPADDLAQAGVRHHVPVSETMVCKDVLRSAGEIWALVMF